MKTKSNTISAPEEDEITSLRRRLAELEGNAVLNKEKKNEEKIQQDEYISVMSLIPFPLNLTTKEGGQGSVKRFTRFGEIKKILYKDLIDILDAHSNFLENGYFYILHKGFIRQNGLDEVYSKILTKEKIELILNTSNADEAVALYNSATPKQQEIIVQMLIGKLRENSDSIDLNIVDRISRVSKTDIAKIAGESLEEKETVAE